MYVKIIPIELVVIVAEDSCNPIDVFLFIWTSMIGLDAGTERAWHKMTKKARG